jgi:hypothetical protein
MDSFPSELLLQLWFDNEPLQFGLEPEPIDDLNFIFGEWIDIEYEVIPLPIVEEVIPLLIEEEIVPPRTPPPREAKRLNKKRKYDRIWERWDADKRKKGKGIIDPDSKKVLKLSFVNYKEIDFSKGTARWLYE